MIALYTEKGWEIITQRAHGLLAGEICAKWKEDDLCGRRVETLVATAGHDDAFNEFSDNKLLDSHGAPLNFKSASFDEQASEVLLDLALTKSRFIALLTARHIAFTHGKEPRAKTFLKKLDKLNQTWMQESESTPEEVDHAYRLLQFCDAFSLLICQRQFPPDARKVEISKGPDGTAYSVYATGEELIISPWPFNTDRFAISYESRSLNDLQFKNDNHFRDELRSVKVIRNFITLAKKPGKITKGARN